MIAESNLLTNCLKEWATVVSALGRGETIMSLRKGGIRESRNKFQVQYSQFWLYPTYEHQKPQLLKPKYREEVTEVSSGWHPATVEIHSCGKITHTLTVDNLETLHRLEPYHIWNRQMVSDRLKWKPQQPLVVLLLRVFNLPTPMTIPYHQSYGGCKSWINLQTAITLQNLQPVLTDNTYQQQVSEILASF